MRKMDPLFDRLQPTGFFAEPRMPSTQITQAEQPEKENAIAATFKLFAKGLNVPSG
jgi:hypothetical protein